MVGTNYDLQNCIEIYREIVVTTYCLNLYDTMLTSLFEFILLWVVTLNL